MAAQRTPSYPPDLMEKVGALVESAERADEDRRNLTRSIEGLAKNVHTLELSVNGMTQASASTSNVIASIAAEKAGERCKALEGRMDRYDRVFGGAGKMAWKIVLAILSSGAAGGIAARLLQH